MFDDFSRKVKKSQLTTTGAIPSFEDTIATNDDIGYESKLSLHRWNFPVAPSG